MAKMMKKAQNGADMVSKIKSAASKPSGDRKMGMNFDKKSFDSLPSILGKPLPKKASKAPKAMMKMGGKCKNGC
jgi:hypothetical protein